MVAAAWAPMLTRGQLANEIKRLMSMDAIGEDACDLVWFREFWKRTTSGGPEIGAPLTGMRFEIKAYEQPEV